MNSSSDQTGRYLDLDTDNQELHSTQMAPFEVSFKYSEIFLIYPEKDSCSAIFQSLLKKTPKTTTATRSLLTKQKSVLSDTVQNQGNTQPQPKISLNTNFIFYSRSIYDTTALNKVCLPRILYKDQTFPG